MTALAEVRKRLRQDAYMGIPIDEWSQHERDILDILDATEWRRDIESAPKDGTRFLTCRHGVVRVAAWGKASHVPLWGFCLADQGAEDFDIIKPTHWMPLPEPPHD